MKLYILVEGKSEEAFLAGWLPRFIPQHTFQIIPHQGKGKLPRDLNAPSKSHHRGLLDQLPMKLRAFGKTLDPEVARVLVLVDQDHDDCRELKQRIQAALGQTNPAPMTMIRIATRETEAFYMGEKKAMRQAFPAMNGRKLDRYHASKEPEAGTWELFAEIIGDGSEDKVAWARAMASAVSSEKPVPKANRSASFRQLCKAILQLVGEPIEKL
ncbi:MAG: DUF4276 family protein [Acidobacteriota bacterium]|nr:DUF4276 family protein [Acidobacteriota bacterium]